MYPPVTRSISATTTAMTTSTATTEVEATTAGEMPGRGEPKTIALAHCQGFIRDFEVGGGGGGGFQSLVLTQRVCFSMSLLGGSGGMPPRKSVKNRCSEIDSETFWRYL